MSLIPVDDCEICKRPDVANINADWINRYSIPEILVKRGIVQTKKIVASLTFHCLKHVTSVALAIARQIISSESTDLVNTVHETNMQILQLDTMRKMVLTRMENETDNNAWQKLMKKLIDIQDKAQKAVRQQHIFTGKDAQQEVAKISLIMMQKEAMREASKSKSPEDIRAAADKKKRSIVDHIFNPSNLEMVLNKLKDTPDYVESNIIDVDIEVGEEDDDDLEEES